MLFNPDIVQKWWIIKVKHPSLDIYRKNIVIFIRNIYFYVYVISGNLPIICENINGPHFPRGKYEAFSHLNTFL